MPLSMKVYSTSDWGAVLPRATPTITDHGNFIVIHHTAVEPSSSGTVEGGIALSKATQRDHMNRKATATTYWIDSGHNFLNTVGGHVFEGRHRTMEAINQGKCVISAHANDPEGNRCPGIENEGNYMTKTMPKIQWDCLVDLCADLCRSLGIAPSQIRGHRDFSATACPGDWLYGQLPNLIADVTGRLEK